MKMKKMMKMRNKFKINDKMDISRIILIYYSIIIKYYKKY